VVSALDSGEGSAPLTTARPDDTSLSRLSVLDWIGVVVVAGSGAVSLVVPLVVAPMFRRLSESVGAPPGTGAGLLQGWIPLGLGLSPLALVAWALGVRQALRRRRLLLVLAFALTVLAGVVSLFALYGTLFTMAGAPAG
jgi:hypothetical protein